MYGSAGLGMLARCVSRFHLLHFHLYKVQYLVGLLPLARSFPP